LRKNRRKEDSEQEHEQEEATMRNREGTKREAEA
jgi:hypothetical protein